MENIELLKMNLAKFSQLFNEKIDCAENLLKKLRGFSYLAGAEIIYKKDKNGQWWEECCDFDDSYWQKISDDKIIEELNYLLSECYCYGSIDNPEFHNVSDGKEWNQFFINENINKINNWIPDIIKTDNNEIIELTA